MNYLDWFGEGQVKRRVWAIWDMNRLRLASHFNFWPVEILGHNNKSGDYEKMVLRYYNNLLPLIDQSETEKTKTSPSNRILSLDPMQRVFGFYILVNGDFTITI